VPHLDDQERSDLFPHILHYFVRNIPQDELRSFPCTESPLSLSQFFSVTFYPDLAQTVGFISLRTVVRSTIVRTV